MPKTLHKKLTEKNYKTHEAYAATCKEDGLLINLVNEMRATLQDAANDLLQPRPEAIAKILNSSKSIV